MNDLNGQSEIKVTKDHNLFHINKGNVQESQIVATIHIAFEYLKRWYNRKDRTSSSKQGKSLVRTVSEHWNYRKGDYDDLHLRQKPKIE